jgi:tetratricopeptide (TPR) repeat protein
MPKKSSRSISQSSAADPMPRVWTAYYLTLAAFFAASFFPEVRVWGINWWAYHPVWLRVLLLALLGGAPLALRVRMTRAGDAWPELSARGYWSIAAVATVVLTALFWLLRARTHFLGDGYQLLDRLAKGESLTKGWDIGAAWLHRLVFDMLSGTPAERALAAHQVVAVITGLLFCLVAFIFARRLFDELNRALLFALVLLSGGYMLQYFGYVENYAVLLLALMVYGLVGLLVLAGKAPFWWTVPPLLVAGLMHVFGLYLLPSLAFLLLRDTKLDRAWSRLAVGPRWLIGAGVVVLGLAVMAGLRAGSFFFTFAFLPLLPDRFTVDSDYLLSAKHWLDTVNLLMLLAPGLLVLAAAGVMNPPRDQARRQAGRFLLWMLLPALVTVFVFNPGIGMPRNWDLFAIAGIPLVLGLGYRALMVNWPWRWLLAVVVLALLPGVSILAGRVASQATPALAIHHFQNYLQLDKVRNRNAGILLVNYYESVGDTAAAREAQARSDAAYPEVALNDQGRRQVAAGQYPQAMLTFRRAIRLNPLYYDSYTNLGVCFSDLGQPDSALAYLAIADGLNPNSPMILSNMGTAHQKKGETETAERCFLRALAIDPATAHALASLVVLYGCDHRASKSMECLRFLATRTALPGSSYLELAQVIAGCGASDLVDSVLAVAGEKGAPRDELERAKGTLPKTQQER